MSHDLLHVAADQFDFSDASCLQTDPKNTEKYWTPERYDSAVAKMARRICGNCVILDACREYALRAQPEQGIWAGMSPAERAVIGGAS